MYLLSPSSRWPPRPPTQEHFPSVNESLNTPQSMRSPVITGRRGIHDQLVIWIALTIRALTEAVSF